jgi:1,4-alpha-glucan branching enzyme
MTKTILTDLDLHLFNEGNHYRIYDKLGSHAVTVDGVAGLHFAVWAPNADRVSVVGDFNQWDGRANTCEPVASSGIWATFVPGLGYGEKYKYEVRARSGALVLKADPYARRFEVPPRSATIAWDTSGYQWGDAQWLAARAARTEHLDEPVSVYEVHLGSWRRGLGNEPLTYRDLAEQLVPYVKDMGYTHVELLPVMEHPFTGSWGYQVTGFFAPTSRFGAPEDFKYFVDACHKAGIGVILDWVPGHFPKDGYGLIQFDGTALYEHLDPRLGEHRDWGTLIFNYGRHEVRNFLLSNALFWLDEYHADGLRVDAVASMLYLDYSRKEGQWVPNRFGGRENIEAIEFIRQLNVVVHEQFPGALMIAEESTAWPAVSRPVYLGGLGFTFKWNMGWMHDMLRYMSKDPVFRKWQHNDITFSMLYAYTENFMLPFSHDEVVHGKGSMVGKMPGDMWQKFANLRALYAALPALHASDADPEGFAWIDLHNGDQSVWAFLRRDPADPDAAPVVCVFNATPVPRDDYWLGVPEPGRYQKLLDTDAPGYGGSGYAPDEWFTADAHEVHGYPFRLRVALPPLAAVLLRVER